MFEGIVGTNKCGLLGSSMTSVTVPFQPWQLSTVGPGGVRIKINLDDLRKCESGGTTYLSNRTDDGDVSTHERGDCFHYLQWSPRDWNVTAINPIWADCVLVGGMIFDPPRALTPASVLAPPTTTIHPRTTTPPGPGPSLEPFLSTTKRYEGTTDDVPSEPRPVSIPLPGAADPPFDFIDPFKSLVQPSSTTSKHILPVPLAIPAHDRPKKTSGPLRNDPLHTNTAFDPETQTKPKDSITTKSHQIEAALPHHGSDAKKSEQNIAGAPHLKSSDPRAKRSSHQVQAQSQRNTMQDLVANTDPQESSPNFSGQGGRLHETRSPNGRGSTDTSVRAIVTTSSDRFIPIKYPEYTGVPASGFGLDQPQPSTQPRGDDQSQATVHAVPGRLYTQTDAASTPDATLTGDSSTAASLYTTATNSYDETAHIFSTSSEQSICSDQISSDASSALGPFSGSTRTSNAIEPSDSSHKSMKLTAISSFNSSTTPTPGIGSSSGFPLSGNVASSSGSNALLPNSAGAQTYMEKINLRIWPILILGTIAALIF